MKVWIIAGLAVFMIFTIWFIEHAYIVVRLTAAIWFMAAIVAMFLFTALIRKVL